MTTLVDQINNNTIYNQFIIDFHNNRPSIRDLPPNLSSIRILTLATEIKEKTSTLEDDIDEKLDDWKRGKTASRRPINFNTVTDRSTLLKKSQITKTIAKCFIIGMIALCALGTALTIIGFAAALPSLALIGDICVLSGLTLPTSCLLITQIGYLIFAESLREKRVNTSENFQAFVRKYVIEKNHFIPDEEDLMDSKLHDIYCNWKKKAKAIFK